MADTFGALLRLREFRFFLAANVVERFAAAAMTVLLGFQIFEITHQTLFVGLLGLVEALPGVTLVLLGGEFADRHDRRTIMLRTTTLLAGFALVLAAAVRFASDLTLPALFVVAFCSATVRAFENPAATGLEARVVPLALVFRGVPLLATSARAADVLGPAAVGFGWAAIGPAETYAGLAGLLLLASILLRIGVAPKPPEPVAGERAPILQRIGEGIGFVFRHEVLWAPMALDLFAVFFGGVTALLPYFATERLGVGAAGFGALRSAMAAGSLLAALLCTRFLPRRQAGAALHIAVACFGVSILVFGLSRSFALSIVALFLSGMSDGVSNVIRNAILRLASPEMLRGRIAAVKSVFVGSSNELGALESGLVSAAIGAVPTVLLGGAVTLAVVAAICWRAPGLRRLDLEALRAPAV